MKRVLILSSHVAASRVGGFAQSLALAALGIDPVLVPTVLFGRHPGLGPPGGGPVEPGLFKAMLQGARDQGAFAQADAVITGYFAHPDQVQAAATAIDAVRAARDGRPCCVLVDPVLGDSGTGLYVKREVAQAVVDELVPRADVLTPNLWELGFIAGRALEDEVAVLAAARGLAPRVLVTSAPAGADRTGVLDVTPHAAWRLSHGRFATAPNGTGDLLAALAVAAILDGETSPNDARRAAAGVVDALDGALALGADNLPLARLGGDLRRPRAPVMIEAL